jgi:hypothetical protein
MTIPLHKHPSALLPLAMSVAALAVVVAHLTLYGTAREADEGTAAHLWQLLMAGQAPLIAYFALRWLPSDPRRGAAVLAAQVAAALAAMFPVWWFQL